MSLTDHIRFRSMGVRIRRVALGALAGAPMGAALLLLELVVVLWGGGRVPAVGRFAFLVWTFGAAAGAVAGAVLAAVLPARRQPGFTNSTGRFSESGAVARALGPWLLFGGAALVLLIQVNHRWLPSIRDPRSVAASLGLAAALAALGWWSRDPVGRAAAGMARSGWRLAGALAGTLALAGVLTLLAPGAPRSTSVTPWHPAPPPAAPLDGSVPGSSRLLVLGIDGARWEVLDPVLSAGRLPQLASLVARGRRGVLRNPDIEHHPSPVAWTSIFTGLPPERHGVVGWESTSKSRTAKALWDILADLGWRSLVVNVPGTYPAERPGEGAMLAGDPAPVSLAGSSSGWWCTADRGSPVDRAVPCPLPPVGGGGEPAALVLRNPGGVRGAFAATSPGLLLWALGVEPPDWLSRALVAVSPPQMQLALSAPGGGGGGILRVRPGGRGGPLLALESGEWSPWLETRVGGEAYRFRLRRTGSPGERGGLFVTPFFRSHVPALAAPSDLLPWLEASGEPYLLGGDASSFGTGDAALVAIHRQLLLELARRRARAALRLQGAMEWDALFHVFTVTDRTQHAFWRFLEPWRYPPGERPSPRRLQAFDGAIPVAYERVDRWLGQLLAGVERSTLVLVVSDHGAQGGMGLPYDHHRDGIYLLAGPGVPPGATPETLGPVLDHVDVLPVTLAHLGLPLAEDLPGRIPAELAPRAADGSPLPLPPPMATYGLRQAAGASERELDPAVRERLRSLGYLD